LIGGDDKPDITTDLPDEQLPDSNPDEGVDDGSDDESSSEDEGTDDDDQSNDDGDDDEAGDEDDDDKDQEDPSDPPEDLTPPHRHRHANQDGELVMANAPDTQCSQQQDEVQREATTVGNECPNGESMGSDANGPADEDIAADDEGQGEEQHQEQESASQEATGNTNRNS